MAIILFVLIFGSGTVFSTVLAQCQKYDRKDVVGSNLDAIHNTPEGRCCDLCRQKSGCRAYAWNDYRGGTCWLKETTQLEDKDGVKAGVLSSDPGDGKCTKHDDQDVSGSNLAEVNNQLETACCEICRQRSGCRAYAWNIYKGGTCWLKTSTRLFSKSGVKAGIIEGVPPIQDGQSLGVCYSPFHHPKYGSAATIREVLEDDFSKIKAAGFTSIRTYYSEYFGIAVTPIARKFRLKLALGVFMFPNNRGWIEGQLNAAANAARDFPDSVSAIYVGNENIHPVGPFNSGDIIGYINRLKSMLRSRNVGHIPVGTVQRYPEWISDRGDVRDIAAASDVLGANLYPFFGPVPWDRAIGELEHQLNRVKQKRPGKTVEITETGWPSGGGHCPSGHERSVSRTRDYFRRVREWAGQKDTKVYYFQFFNKKANQGNNCENYFGLAEASGRMKFDL